MYVWYVRWTRFFFIVDCIARPLEFPHAAPPDHLRGESGFPDSRRGGQAAATPGSEAAGAAAAAATQEGRRGNEGKPGQRGPIGNCPQQNFWSRITKV